MIIAAAATISEELRNDDCEAKAVSSASCLVQSFTPGGDKLKGATKSNNSLFQEEIRTRK